MSDLDRYEFLVALDKSNVTVTPWEAEFIESRLQWGKAVFSIKQQQVIDRLIERYAGRIDW